MSEPLISAVVVTYNADWRLERCLESLRYADELIVVDMCSSDDTVTRARRYTDRVFVRDGGGDINGNANFGIAQARGTYIHVAAQDHVIPPTLAAELRAFADADQVDVVIIEQRTFKFGKELRHGAADERATPFFYRKGKVVIPAGALHRWPSICDGARVATASHALLHNSDVTISDWITKLNRFTDLDVQRLGFAHHGDILRPFGCARVALRMAHMFWNLYFRRRGYRDGEHGFLLAMFLAFYHLTEEAKLFEQHWDGTLVPEELRAPAPDQLKDAAGAQPHG